MKSKSEIRKTAKETRKTLPIADISKKIVEKIKQSDVYKNAKNIMIFYPLKYEIDLLALTDDSSKNFYLPRVNGEMLDVCPYKKGDSLSKSSLKVLEPTTDAIDKNILDLVLCPALTADKRGYRLGYGGGYYDRFLKGLPSSNAIVIEKELIVDTLPIDEYDEKCDLIFSA